VAFLYFLSVFYEFTVLVFLLDRKWVQKMRDRAEGFYAASWGQSWSIMPRFWLTYCLLLLPLNVFAQYVGVKFVPGTPGWGSWVFSWGSSFVAELLYRVCLTVRDQEVGGSNIRAFVSTCAAKSVSRISNWILRAAATPSFHGTL